MSARWRWPAVALAAAFFTSSVFSGYLHWGRDAFIGAWLGVAVLVIGAWVASEGWSPAVQLRRRWAAGLAVGIVMGALVGWMATRGPVEGGGGSVSVQRFLWLAVVYGTVDAVMLSVVPVLALYGTRPGDDAGYGSRLGRALLALVASLVITAFYHLGFAEFRGGALMAPLVGNLVVTLAYLLGGNPLAPIIAHIMLHGAALLHGAGAGGVLPPH